MYFKNGSSLSMRFLFLMLVYIFLVLNCIGFYNYKFFMNVLIYSDLSLLFILSTYSECFIDAFYSINVNYYHIILSCIILDFNYVFIRNHSTIYILLYFRKPFNTLYNFSFLVNLLWENNVRILRKKWNKSFITFYHKKCFSPIVKARYKIYKVFLVLTIWGFNHISSYFLIGWKALIK